MTISRRALLKGTGAAFAVGGLTAACGSSGGAKPKGSSSSSAAPVASASPVAGPSPTTAATGYVLHSDLSYAAPVGRAHLLDLYVPNGGAEPFPVVIYQSGSAFLSDDTKSGMPPGGPPGGAVPGGAAGGAPAGLGGITTAASLAKMWAPHGYAVVGLNVRSSRQAHFPAQVYDIKAAIRYLRANASTYHLDTTRFATIGTSSGSWTSMMAGLTGGVASLEGDLGNPGQSTEVAAVIDLFGPTDFLELGPAHDAAGSPESLLMGFALQTNRPETEKASPVSYVKSSSPPIYISHGLADPLIPYSQSELLFDAYQKAGATASLTLVPKAVHTDAYLASAADSLGRTVRQTKDGKTNTGTEPAPTYATLLAFLDTHLKG